MVSNLPPAPTPASQAPDHDHPPIRPTGAWVVGGFLILVICLMWGLVSYIFTYRS